MAIEAQSVHVTLPLTRTAFGQPSRVEVGKAVFKRRVKAAEAALKGFHLQYGDNDDDRNFYIHQVSIQNVAANDNVVTFEVHAMVQDENVVNVVGGEHPIEGAVAVVVIARTD